MAAKFLLQTSHCIGFYNNPFKRGGKAAQFSKWATIASVNTVEEAEKLWLAKNAERGSTKGYMDKIRVQYTGKTVIKPNGVVYELRKGVDGGIDTWGLYFKKDLLERKF